MPQINYQQSYQSLGLTGAADWEDVKSSYQRLAQDHHPDRQKNGGTQENSDRFIKINKAYHSLRDYRQKHNRLPDPGNCNYSQNKTTLKKTNISSEWDSGVFYTQVRSSEFDAIMEQEVQNKANARKVNEISAKRNLPFKVIASTMIILCALAALGWFLSALNENQTRLISNRAIQTLEEQGNINPVIIQPGQLLAQ